MARKFRRYDLFEVHAPLWYTAPYNMSIDNMVRSADTKRIHSMLVSFLAAGGDPGLPFVRKYLVKENLTLHDLCPERYGPAQQTLVDENTSPMVNSIDRIFGALSIQSTPNPAPLDKPAPEVQEFSLEDMDF